MNYPYDTDYDPPMPVVEVVLRTPALGQQTETLPAIVDTGADGTLVPTRHLKRIGAVAAFETGMRSPWGERRAVFYYVVDIQIASLTLPGTLVVGDDLGDELLLGRNVLNRLRLLLDGPSMTTQLQGERL